MRLGSTMVVMVVCAILSLSGCASIQSKFVPKTKENVGAFADTTIAMLNSLDVGFDRNETIYLREFFRAEGAEEKRLIANSKALNAAFKNIIRYSLQLVLIAETHKEATERVSAYADFLSKVDPKLIEDRGFDKQYYFELVDEIKVQEEFLDALKTAQPIISAIAYYVNSLIDERQAAIEALAIIVEGRIDDRYSEVIRYQKILETEKYAVLRAMEYLYSTYAGNAGAFDKLLSSGAIRDKKLIPNGKPSDADMARLAEHLGARLKTMQLIGEEIKTDWDTYRATHRELDSAHAAAMDRLNKARLMILIWLRAHQKMAAGVASPAEWFNVKELPSQLINVGKDVVF